MQRRDPADRPCRLLTAPAQVRRARAAPDRRSPGKQKSDTAREHPPERTRAPRTPTGPAAHGPAGVPLRSSLPWLWPQARPGEADRRTRGCSHPARQEEAPQISATTQAGLSLRRRPPLRQPHQFVPESCGGYPHSTLPGRSHTGGTCTTFPVSLRATEGAPTTPFAALRLSSSRAVRGRRRALRHGEGLVALFAGIERAGRASDFRWLPAWSLSSPLCPSVAQ